jgi:two-component system cell cycle response regulator
LTALDRPADRVRGLEAGADDFLTKPVDEIALIARVRSLVRLKFSIDELRNRAAHNAEAGMIAPAEALNLNASERGRLLLVDEQRSSSERIVGALSPYHDVIAHQRAGRSARYGARRGGRPHDRQSRLWRVRRPEAVQSGAFA